MCDCDRDKDCKYIVPFSMNDVCAGRDIVNQGLSKGVKTSDGTIWTLVNHRTGWIVRDGKVCRE